MKKPIVWIFALTMTVCATLVLSLSCISFSLQNTALKNEVGDLNNKNSELNKQVQDLNNVIGDLQKTVDFFEDQVALITYEVDGQVWKIDVAQVGEKIELPVAPDTATETEKASVFGIDIEGGSFFTMERTKSHHIATSSLQINIGGYYIGNIRAHFEF